MSSWRDSIKRGMIQLIFIAMGFGKLTVHKPKLEQLRSTGKIKEKRRELLTKATIPFLCVICACCLNVLNGVVQLTKKQHNTLVRHRNLFLQLIDQSVPLEKKRELLIQRGGFLPALLTTILQHGRKTNGARTR